MLNLYSLMMTNYLNDSIARPRSRPLPQVCFALFHMQRSTDNGFPFTLLEVDSDALVESSICPGNLIALKMVNCSLFERASYLQTFVRNSKASLNSHVCKPAFRTTATSRSFHDSLESRLVTLLTRDESLYARVLNMTDDETPCVQ